jgi:MFS family permease
MDDAARSTGAANDPGSRRAGFRGAGSGRAQGGAGGSVAQGQAEAHRRAGRRALFAAFLGFFVDMFDVYLPVVVLAPAMAYFQPDSLSSTLKSTLFYIVFALSLVGRPAGAAVFGHLSDKIGRRKVTIISMAGFALVTLLIGILPGYEQWGMASIVLLIVLRFVDGIFLGGECAGANPLAMEYAPKQQRGLWSAFIHTGFPLAFASMCLLTLGLLSRISSGSRHSAYVLWGWRIPFFLGSALGFAVLLYFVRCVPESPVWSTAKKVKAPLLELFRGGNLRIFAQIFLVMSGVWLMLNAVTSILPGVLLTFRPVSSVTVTWAQLIASLVLACAFVPFGVLGQKIGRRTILWLFGLAGLTAGPAFYYLLMRSGYRSTAELVVLVTLINLCALPVWSNITAYLSERFSTGVRASGYGVGYSAAIILPAFSSVYMLGLHRLGIPYEYTQIVLLALGGLLTLVGALAGPETHHVEIA